MPDYIICFECGKMYDLTDKKESKTYRKTHNKRGHKY